MAVTLLFFAASADWSGRKRMEIAVDGPRSVEDLIRTVPGLGEFLVHRKSLKVAVNHEFCGFDTEVEDGDEVAFLPPVSGG